MTPSCKNVAGLGYPTPPSHRPSLIPSWPNNPNASTPYPKLPATHKLSDCLAFPDVRAGGVPAPQIRESTQPKHATRSHTSFT